MGNRVGSPPSRGTDEQPEEQPQDDDTRQSGLGDVTEEDETTSDDVKPEVPQDDEPQGGGGIGGLIVTPNPPETEPPEDTPEDEPVLEDGHEPEDDTAPDDHTIKPEEHEDSDEQDDVEESEFGFVYGDIVHDREFESPEDEEPIDLVVVALPDEIITKWVHDEDGTLADRNPGYPSIDDVIITVEKDILDNSFPGWDEREEEIPVDQLDEDGIDYIAFPSLRLLLKESSHLRPSSKSHN